MTNLDRFKEILSQYGEDTSEVCKALKKEFPEIPITFSSKGITLTLTKEFLLDSYKKSEE